MIKIRIHNTGKGTHESKSRLRFYKIHLQLPYEKKHDSSDTTKKTCKVETFILLKKDIH